MKKLPVAIFICIAGIYVATAVAWCHVVTLPACQRYPADYYLQCEPAAIYVLDGTHPHDTVAIIPYADSGSQMWDIVTRDNQ